MAAETGRVFKRKRIKLPDGDTVDIPVISQISFLDPADRGWETQYTIDNTTDSDRTVRIASVPGDGAPTDESGQGGDSGDTTQTLQVERIDRFKLSDDADRGQETYPEPDSKTVAEPPDAPPYFTTHAKTHIVKYIKRNDDDSEDNTIWIKSELIDEWHFGDDADRGQETQFTLTNPSQDNQGFDGLRFGTDPDDSSIITISVDPSMEEITSGVGGSDEGDKPVRTDPFQNIVDWLANPPIFIFSIKATNAISTTIGGTDQGSLEDSADNPGTPFPRLPSPQIYSQTYFSSFQLTCFSKGKQLSKKETSGVITGDGPTVMLSKTSFSYEPWLYYSDAGLTPPDGGTVNAFGNRFGPGVGTTPSGPPLVINGKTIPFFSSALSVTLNVHGYLFVTAPIGPYTELIGGLDAGEWYSFITGIVDPTGFGEPGSYNVTVESYTLTVSPDPFTFNGKRYKAMGLPISQDYTVSTDLTVPGPTPQQMIIYCIRADDNPTGG